MQLLFAKSKPHLLCRADEAQRLLMTVPLLHESLSEEEPLYFLNRLRTWYSMNAQTQRTRMILITNPKCCSPPPAVPTMYSVAAASIQRLERVRP